MNFALFVLLNAVLLIRPEELFPAIAGARLYLILITACTIFSLPRLIELLSWDSLQRRPVAVCVLLFFASTIVSLTACGRVEEALLEFGPEFAKVVLYYFLLLATVDTEEKFQLFAASLVLAIAGLTAVALAQHYEYVEFANIIPCIQKDIDPVTGDQIQFPRLVSSGIFNDPNDLCLILGLGIQCCIYLVTASAWPLMFRLLWLLPIPVFGFAILETHSRGGLMGVLAGGAAYLFSRFGGPRALPLAAAAALGGLLLVGGRQASISGDTAHERLMMWADGLTNLLNTPFSIPTGLGIGWFVDETAHVAHNSFIQAYVELGVFGGGAFLGMFILSLLLLYRLGGSIRAPAWVVESRHFAFAVVAGYAMGCYSITRNFVVPTYIVIGIGSVLLDQVADRLPEQHTVTWAWLKRCIFLAILGLVAMKVATQVLGQAGV